MAAVADEAARRGIWVLARPLLREADLRPGPAQPAAGAASRHPRPHGAVRVRVEGVRDDRLAMRLGIGPGGGRSPRANALQSHSTSNVCSITQKAVTAGAHRTAGLRNRDARRVPEPPRSAVRVAGGRTADPHASSRQARSICSRTPQRLSLARRHPHERGAGAGAAREARASRSRRARRSMRRASSASRTRRRWRS